MIRKKIELKPEYFSLSDSFDLTDERAEELNAIAQELISDEIDVCKILIKFWNDDRITTRELMLLSFHVGRGAVQETWSKKTYVH